MNLYRSLWIKLMMLTVLPCLASQAWSKQILVDDDRVECPAATFTSIQAAVNDASPGDQIIVCKGVYREQVIIHKSLSIDAIVRPVTN